jgi:2-polyprenyl-6-methoxyphenol hydroxylase-like FAD-dependent oxidoreductase
VPRGGVLAAIEGDRFILTVSGILGDHPPIDPTGFEAFAATLVFPDITQALEDAEPLDDPVAIRFPAGVRRRYERLRRFPQQLLVTGDAVCSFNPVYGQGMTVAALEALALRRLLAGGVPQPRRYFRDIARLVDVAWDMAVGGDLAFPQVPGPRPMTVRLVNAYLARLQAAAASDASLATAFIRVVGMLDRPETLLRPDRVIRVLRAPRHPAEQACPQPGISRLE